MIPLMEKEEDLNESLYQDYTTLGDQGWRCVTLLPNAGATVSRSILKKAALRERIALTAYNLYVQRGRAPGHDLDDWLEAEQMVLHEVEPPGRKALEERLSE